MAAIENIGKSNEWYTPKYLFDALGEKFDLDVAHPTDPDLTFVPCEDFISEGSLDRHWRGFVWMNPPFGGRNGMVPWLDRFYEHGNGIALSTDKSSSGWWQDSAHKCDAMLAIRGRVRFYTPSGDRGGQPVNGTTLWASGYRGVNALRRAEKNGLGAFFSRKR